MKYTLNQADPYLHIIWVKGELEIWISWVDDFLLTGPKKMVQMGEKENDEYL